MKEAKIEAERDTQRICGDGNLKISGWLPDYDTDVKSREVYA